MTGHDNFNLYVFKLNTEDDVRNLTALIWCNIYAGNWSQSILCLSGTGTSIYSC